MSWSGRDASLLFLKGRHGTTNESTSSRHSILTTGNTRNAESGVNTLEPASMSESLGGNPMTEAQERGLMAALEQINKRLSNLEQGQENLQEQVEEAVQRFEDNVRDLMAEREEL